MKNLTKIMTGLGIVSCLGIGAMPLGSAFADNTASKQVNLYLYPTSAISAQALVGGTDSEVSETPAVQDITVVPGGSVATGTTKITCATNSRTGYTVTVRSTATNNNTGVSKLVSGANSIPSSTTFVDGSDVTQSAYAINTPNDSTDHVVPSNDSNATPLTVATSNTTANNTIYYATWKVSASTGQAAGTYTDTVVFTISPSADNSLKPDMVSKLQALATSLGHTPSETEVDAASDMPSSSYYITQYGSWAAALAAAGLSS